MDGHAEKEGYGDRRDGLEMKHMAIHVEPAERTIITPPAIAMKVQYRRHPDG